MRTTISVEDELVERAKSLTGIKETNAVLRAALEALVALESAKRLAALGGSDRAAESAPRRRPAKAS